MASVPRQPTGTDAEAHFHRQTHEELHTGKNDLISGPGVRVSKTTRGRKVEFLNYRSPAAVAFYPFKIYNNAAGGWLSYRVRLGSLFGASYYNHDKIFALLPDGTDGVEWPDSNALTGDFPSTTYVLETGEITWFYVVITSASTDGGIQTAEIVASSDPASDGWDGYPNFNPYIIPLGFVDTAVKEDQKIGMVNQIQRGHITLTPSVIGSIGSLSLVGTQVYCNDFIADNYGARGYPAGYVVRTPGTGKHYVSLRWFNNDDPAPSPFWQELTAPV